MKITNLKKIYYGLLLFGVSIPFKVFSANPQVIGGGGTGGQIIGGGGTQGGLQNPIKVDSIPDLIKAIIDIVLAVGTPIAVLFLIFTGFKFVTARGNPTELTKAKEMLMWTIVGIVVLLGARVLAAVISGTITQLKQGL